MFSNYALFHGLAVFVDTYSNHDATDVSADSGFDRRHAVCRSVLVSSRYMWSDSAGTSLFPPVCLTVLAVGTLTDVVAALLFTAALTCARCFFQIAAEIFITNHNSVNI